MTQEIISIITVFACQFNRPTWKNIQTLFLGAILCRGARRVTTILRWYDKKGDLTFVDIITVVRRSIWSKRFSKSETHDDFVKSIGQDVKLILEQLAIAA